VYKDELQLRSQLAQTAAQRQAETAATPRTATKRGPADSMMAQAQALQRSIGNQAVQRLIAQRQGPLGEEDDTSLQLQADGMEEDEEVPAQLTADEAAPAAKADIGAQIQASAGHGSPLDTQTQRQLEGGLGADLSGVRVHADAQADQLSRAVDAVAFTSGSDIYFRQGAYNPGSADGQHLLAHEATHVVQQSAGPVAGTPSAGGVSLSDPGDAFERAAETSAAQLTAPADQGDWTEEASGS